MGQETSSKRGFFTNIEKDTLSNEKFRKVLYTGENLQLVLMTLGPNEEIGKEIHENDQFFRFEGGEGKVQVNNSEYKVGDGDCVIIPAGSEHNVINTGAESFKMYTIYSPPHHKDGITHRAKDDAVKGEKEFDGKTSE
jgi:mannose-6-phosphate isomerase-like protein (cupin superfamily)